MHGARPAAGVNRWWVRTYISTSSFLLSYKKNCLLLPFRCFPIMSSLNKTFCATTTRYSFYDSYNVRSHVFSIVSARAQTRLFRLLFVFERRVVFWQEHQHHSQRDDQNDANKKGDDDAHQNRSGIIIDRRRIRRRRRFHRRHRTALKKRQKQSQTRFKKSKSAER